MSRREPDGRHLEKKRKNIFEFCLGATLLNKPEITRRKLGKHTGSLKELKGMADSHGILSKCVLEVLVVWGAMVGFLTSIECAYNVPLIFAAYAMMALFFSWIFKTDKGSVVCCVSGIVYRVCGGVQKIHKQWFLCHDK